MCEVVDIVNDAEIFEPQLHGHVVGNPLSEHFAGGARAEKVIIFIT